MVTAFAICGFLSAALGGMLTGCGKEEGDDSAQPAMPDPLSAAEGERGLEACEAYAKRVCACAASKPDDADMKELCELAPAKLSSLKMVLAVNRSPETGDERIKTTSTAKRIIGSCITEQSKLDSKGCSRASP